MDKKFIFVLGFGITLIIVGTLVWFSTKNLLLGGLGIIVGIAAIMLYLITRESAPTDTLKAMVEHNIEEDKLRYAELEHQLKKIPEMTGHSPRAFHNSLYGRWGLVKHQLIYEGGEQDLDEYMPRESFPMPRFDVHVFHVEQLNSRRHDLWYVLDLRNGRVIESFNAHNPDAARMWVESHMARDDSKQISIKDLPNLAPLMNPLMGQPVVGISTQAANEQEKKNQ